MKEFEHQKLRELPNNFPAEIAENIDAPPRQPTAPKNLAELAKLTDPALLADLAKNAKNNGVRLSAAYRLDDRDLAQKIFAD